MAKEKLTSKQEPISRDISKMASPTAMMVYLSFLREVIIVGKSKTLSLMARVSITMLIIEIGIGAILLMINLKGLGQRNFRMGTDMRGSSETVIKMAEENSPGETG